MIRRALQEARLILEADTYATWRFPTSYVAERLVRYMPVFPIIRILRRLALSPRLERYEIGVTLT